VRPRPRPAAPRPAAPRAAPRAPLLSGEAAQHNFRVMDHARSSLALFAGAAAGILGLHSLAGFAFYLAASLAMSAVWWAAMRCAPARFLPSPSLVWTAGVFDGLSSYVLFWTLAYGLVHVYE
ncbi:Rab5-interacting protein-domain-containing protein, partial [Entophlyctis helioformis]